MSSGLRLDAARGLRAGLALALGEIALAFPARWPELASAELRALLLLLPLGLYPGLGAGLAALVGAAGRRRGAAWAGGGAALLAAGSAWAADLVRAPAGLAEPAAWPFLAGAVLILAGVRRCPGSRSLAAAGAGATLAAGLLAALWFGRERDPVLLPPPVGPIPDGPDVVLVTWDTVRADVLPPWGGRGLETPALDALTARSVRLDELIAVAPITGPTHATLLSGLVPPSHGLRSMGTTVIAPEVRLLPEVFRAAGYDTAAFVAAPPLRAKNGFARGFRIYDDRLRGDRARDLTEIGPREMLFARWLREKVVHHRDAQLPGEVVLGRARRFLAAAERPFFLWLHFFDAHGPHDPAPEWEARARALADEAAPAADPEACGEDLLLYRAEIMELDRLLGELLALLEERDPGLARTALLLTADHGQCFGEGGYRSTHTPSLMEATQRVPAILHLPGDRLAGSSLAATAFQVDVAATLAAVAGLEPPPGQQGVDLLPALAGGPPPTRRFFAEGLYLEAWQERLARVRRPDGIHDERLRGIRTDAWKLVESAAEPPVVRLFRLLPEGETEVAPESFPEETTRLRRLLAATVAGLPRAAGAERAMSAADSAELGALGYVEDDG